MMFANNFRSALPHSVLNYDAYMRQFSYNDAYMRRTDDFTSSMALKTLESLGQRLRAARRARKWSLSQLEERVRIHRTTLARLERGDTTVSLSVLLRVLEAFGLLSDLELLASHPGLTGTAVTRRDVPDLPNDF